MSSPRFGKPRRGPARGGNGAGKSKAFKCPGCGYRALQRFSFTDLGRCARCTRDVQPGEIKP